MSTTIDIDIGGTFTDCICIRDGQLIREKTPTTRYNLAVGFRRVVESAAERLDLSLDELLAQTDIIRYSTTLAMNTLIERNGPKLGLITTAGHEHMILIGRSRQWADGLHPNAKRDLSKISKPQPLIPIDLTVGVRERMDYAGRPVMPIDRNDVREKVQNLVDRGARGFVVSLLWSYVNPMHERIVREIIQEEYPDRYLGNMPVVLASEVQPKWHEYPRTNVTILNAYLHTEMTEQLAGLGDELHDFGYRKPLVMVNNVGGMAKVSRTRAVDTYGAGPIAGLFGAAHLGRLYDTPNVVVSDMGGTSFDIGVVVNGGINSYVSWPVIDRWATEQSMIEVKTIGAGGGSIAWINELLGDKLEVGPQSASANPGPACYDLGGTEPTVTDADVVLGYLNPEYFLGGRMVLNKEKAEAAIKKKIADRLGISVVEAASRIRQTVDAKMGDIIATELTTRGLDPRDFVIFAYGGAGPAHCCDYATSLGRPRIVTFSFGSVFCALGGSTMDLKHVYERSRHLTLYDPSTTDGSFFLKDYDAFNEMVVELEKTALRDLRSEGYQREDVTFSLELDMRYALQQFVTRARMPLLSVHSTEDCKTVFDAFTEEYIRRYTALSVYPEGGVTIENFVLTVCVPLPKVQLQSHESEGEDGSSARKGSRPVYWMDEGRFIDTPVYQAESLRCGNIVDGPAVIEAEDTTYVIPGSRQYRIDRYLNGIIE